MKKHILAKSSGMSLIDHSILVSRISVEIAKQSLLIKDPQLIDAIKLSALLHDIGKCTTQFQKKLGGTNIDEENIEAKLTYRHNEVGWGFLSRYLSISKRELSIILDSVYWHHGISNKMSSYNDTDIEISDNDIDTMNEYLSKFVNKDNIGEKTYLPKKSPKYYIVGEDADEINSERLLTRTCIISADRLASNIDNININDDEIINLIINSNLRSCDVDITKHKFYGNERFNLQKDIINNVLRTTQINAPAGFGKTLLGLLWNFKTNKKLIWVCPRNMVAESVYNSILEELKSFGMNDLSVELYLSGEVKAHNDSFKEGFSSDIIITNIDNYLSPSVDNRHGARLYTIINSDVVFDEFHELVGEAGLFACFINIMLTRHRLTNSNTLLLSATATNMYKLWDSINQKTCILPEPGKHYPAQHKNKYLLKTTNELKQEDNDSLYVLNSIANAQRYKHEFGIETLLHGKFEDFHKESNIELLYNNYGKESKFNGSKPNIIGTHILQASLDISFKNLYDSVLSPQSTLQRIGRCDRWGCYNQSSINIILLQNKGEDTMRNTLYTNNLANMWFNYISQHNNKEVNLDELYMIYNGFETDNSKVLDRYLRDKYTTSLDVLTHIHPVKFYNTKKGDIKTAGGNKLRSSNSEIFVICKYYNGDGFTNPYSISVRNNDFEKEFNEHSGTLKQLLGSMKELRNTNDDRFDYNELLNNKKYLTIDSIRKFSKKSNTPYIRFDKVYHPEYGEISQEHLKKYL